MYLLLNKPVVLDIRPKQQYVIFDVMLQDDMQ